MWQGRLGILALLAVAGASLVLQPAYEARADSPPPPGYDISWPQCPGTVPQGDFAFAVIGLNNGRPFSTNDCFLAQYRWARAAHVHPDVYINLDFPRADDPRGATGPHGRCEAGDDWCRGYNYGHAIAKDSIGRTMALGVSPRRYWLDVEVLNHWSPSTENNAEVVRGAVDYFLDFNIPIGLYGTRYQWGLITGSFGESAKLPLWVAGATDRLSAAERCDDPSYTFAGGETWLVQYPEGDFDGNVICPNAVRAAALVTSAAAEAALGPESSNPRSRPSGTPIFRFPLALSASPNEWRNILPTTTRGKPD